MLKGIENSGCLLVTAGHAEVLNRLHRPTQSGKKLLNKKTWVGRLENMQVACCIHEKISYLSAYKLLTTCVCSANRTLSTSLEQAVNNLCKQPC